MTEISFALDGEQEHMAYVVEQAVIEQNGGGEVDFDAQAKRVFVQHLLQQYGKVVNP